jgi:hypothetical protein
MQSLTAGAGDAECPGCHRQTSAVIFPSLLKDSATKPPQLPPTPPGEGEAACFYSPNRRATRECHHCGVLISDQWAAQWGSQTVCLKCLDHLREQSRDGRFETRRTLWDNIALLLAVLPFTIVFWWTIFFSAPAAVFIAMWHWNSPRSMVPRSRFRLVCAMILGLLQITGGLFLILNLWFHWY